MLISELIDHLELERQLHGDIPVKLYNTNTKVRKVKKDQNFDEINIF